MTRFSPVREIACKAIVGRLDPRPASLIGRGPDERGSPLLRGRSAVRVRPGRPSAHTVADPMDGRGWASQRGSRPRPLL